MHYDIRCRYSIRDNSATVPIDQRQFAVSQLHEEVLCSLYSFAITLENLIIHYRKSAIMKKGQE